LTFILYYQNDGSYFFKGKGLGSWFHFNFENFSVLRNAIIPLVSYLLMLFPFLGWFWKNSLQTSFSVLIFLLFIIFWTFVQISMLFFVSFLNCFNWENDFKLQMQNFNLFSSFIFSGVEIGNKCLELNNMIFISRSSWFLLPSKSKT
jgi:hypothetical protein